jgi:WD40 repeat protein
MANAMAAQTQSLELKQVDHQRLKVFICYSRADMTAADSLVERLEDIGFEVAIDRRDLPYGEEWQKELADLIATADTVVWLITPRSLSSKWCRWELGEVNRLHKRLLPIRIEPVPTDELPDSLRKIHVLPAQGLFTLSDHLAALGAALNADRAWIKDHTRLADRAREWQARSRTNALLLRGAALKAAETWRVHKPSAEAPAAEVLDLILTSRQASTRRQRYWIAGSLTLAFAALALTGAALWQRGLAIESERVATDERVRAQDNEKRALLQEQLAKDNEQATRKERDAALISQSRYLTNFAREQLKSGNVENAISLLRRALPKDIANPDRPIYRPALMLANQAIVTRRQRATPSNNELRFSAIDAPRDGSRLFAATTDGRILAIAPETGQREQIASLPSEVIVKMRSSTNGDALAVATKSGKIALIAVDSGRVVFDLDLKKYRTSPDFDLRGFYDRPIRSMISDTIRGIEFSGDRKDVAFASENSLIFVVSMETSTLRKVLRGHSYRVTAIDISADSSMLASASDDGTVNLWNLQTGELLHRFYDEAAVPEGNRSEANDSAASPQGATAVPSLLISSIKDVRFDATSSRLITAEWGGIPRTDRADGDERLNFGVAILWDLRTRKEMKRFRSAGYTSIASFNNAGTQVLTASADGLATVWDVTTGRPIANLPHDGRFVEHAEFTEDDRHIVTASFEGTIKIWRVEESSIFSLLQFPTDELAAHSNRLLAARTLARSFIASLDEAGKLVIWDMTKPSVAEFVTPLLPKIDRKVSAVRFDTRGNFLGVGYYNGSFEIYRREKDNSAWAQVFAVDAHAEQITDLAFDAKGEIVATGSADKTVKLWSLVNGELQNTLGPLSASVRSLDTDPQGTFLAAGLANGKGLIWILRTGELRTTLEDHSQAVNSVRFGARGDELVSTSDDGSTYIYGFFLVENDQWRFGPRLQIGSKKKARYSDFNQSDRFLIIAYENELQLLEKTQFSQRKQALDFRLLGTIRRRDISRVEFLDTPGFIAIESAEFGIEVYSLLNREKPLLLAKTAGRSFSHMAFSADRMAVAIDSVRVAVLPVNLADEIIFSQLLKATDSVEDLSRSAGCRFLVLPDSDC